MEEKILFNEGNVQVSSTRFIVGNQTYAMNGVTSVKSHVSKPNKVGPILGIIAGLFIAFSAEGAGKVIGLGIAAVAGFILYNQKATYAVVLNSSSGETQALADHDGDYISNVVSALNDALVHRG